MHELYDADILVELYDFFLNAPVAYQILDDEGVVLLANDAALRLAGCPGEPRRLVGGELDSIDPGASAPGGWLAELRAGRSVVDFPSRVRSLDGSDSDVLVFANATRTDGEAAATRCVMVPADDRFATQRTLPSRAAEPLLDAMTESERARLAELLEDAFDNAPVGLHIVGPDGLVKRANRLELANLGYADRPQDYLGHHIAEFHAEQAVIDEMLESLVSGRPLVHYPATLKRSDGERQSVVIYSTPRFDDGDFVNTRCFTLPQARPAPRPAAFGWPHNDAAVETAGANPLTSALQRMAGRRQAESSLGFLAEASKALAPRRDRQAGVQQVCELAVPFLADWCAVEIDGSKGGDFLAIARGFGLTGSDALIRQYVDGGAEPAAVADRLAIAFETGEAAGRLLLVRGKHREGFGPADVALAEELGRRLEAALWHGQPVTADPVSG